jgi:(2Fe-2S) ferredoxin
MDAERARRCHEACVVAGYDEGAIGPSVDRSAAGRFVASTCTADSLPPLEQRADTISGG